MGKGMKAGKKPGGGNAGQMQKQMAQMQAMQRKMAELQDEIDQMETSATSGGGAVTITVNGARQLTKVEIKPEVVDPDDAEMLEDLILTATNEALRQIEEISSQEMNKVTGGLGIPGL
jgi:DNA-binding YbaB/EbfC family protein